MKKTNKIIAVDFDGTLANTPKYPVISEPIQEILDYVKKEKSRGAYIILLTMREGPYLEQAVKWCEEQGLEFDAVNDNLPHIIDFFGNNPRKIFCNEYIDNTNFGGIDFIIHSLKSKKGK